MKRQIRLTESELHRLIEGTVRRIIKEDFEEDYNNARENYNRPLWGFEMKNNEGEWEYGNIEYNPNNQTMSCMGATINVDTDMSVDENVQALYDELVNKGYTD